MNRNGTEDGNAVPLKLPSECDIILIHMCSILGTYFIHCTQVVFLETTLLQPVSQCVQRIQRDCLLQTSCHSVILGLNKK